MKFDAILTNFKAKSVWIIGNVKQVQGFMQTLSIDIVKFLQMTPRIQEKNNCVLVLSHSSLKWEFIMSAALKTFVLLYCTFSIWMIPSWCKDFSVRY